ncbi:hypothetical protein JKF63_00699 [Porcisia hertigi]|uniref:Uncharacterized protein n=1 Tax=Porcisia hertigi TaxID=2761500 RepID=A0A836KXE7_9TRYP|nr:hypothetical protein JKF63_00699 [Porcisia hertigi]
MHAMNDACPFHPQINPRSRRLARNAPTLRERQGQEQQQSIGREVHSAQPQRGTATPGPRVQEFAVKTENDVAESVWDLWRAVATEEARETEAAFVRPVHSRNGDDSRQDRRPRVVYVKTVLGMLNALGVTSPQHDNLIAKFLKAMAVESGASEASKRDTTVDAARFMYVFSTVWRAAVTNRTRPLPTPAQVAVLRCSTPVVRQRGSSSSGATMRRTYAEENPRRGALPSPMKTSPTPAPSSEVGNSGGSFSVVSEGTSSPLSVVDISNGSSVGEAHSDKGSASPSTSSGNGNERESNAAHSDADFLRTNMSSASSSTPGSETEPQAGIRSQEQSPVSMGPLAGLSSSPELRNPVKLVTNTPTCPSVTPRTQHRSPFAAAAPLCSAAMLHTRRVCSTLRAIPSDSNLLSSTASRELKRATKCVPGGLMRECTFKPVINPVHEQLPVSSRSAAVVPKRRPASTPPPTTLQSNTQPLRLGRGNLAGWESKPFDDDGGNRSQAAAVPLAAEFETAVRRMVAARQQQQRLQSPQPTMQNVGHHSATTPQSVVQATEANSRKPLLYVDIDLPQGIRDRLALYAGDNVHHVAQRFGILHGLTDSLRQRLETALTAELRALAVQRPV